MKIHILNEWLKRYEFMFTHFWWLGSQKVQCSIYSIPGLQMAILTWLFIGECVQKKNKPPKLSVCLSMGTPTISELGSHTYK